MKKIVLAIALSLIIVFSISAKSVDELDGNDWMGWSYQTKSTFVAGYFNAMRAAYESFVDFYDDSKDSEAQLARLYDLFIYQQSISDVIKIVDTAYRVEEDNHFYIWGMIGYLCGKELR